MAGLKNPIGDPHVGIPVILVKCHLKPCKTEKKKNIIILFLDGSQLILPLGKPTAEL